MLHPIICWRIYYQLLILLSITSIPNIDDLSNINVKVDIGKDGVVIV